MTNYNDVNWAIRTDERIEGISDHIEEHFEAIVSFKDETTDYYEIFNPENTIDELKDVVSISDISSIELIKTIRRWKDEHPSEWVAVQKVSIAY